MSDTLEDIDTRQLDNVGRVKVDTPSNVTILDMTEDCTRLVFDRLTLNQLIHLRAVCHAWNDIITIICQQKIKLQISFSTLSDIEYFRQTLRLSIQEAPLYQLNNQNLLRISAVIQGPTSQKALKRSRDGSFSDQQNDPNLGIRFIARLFPNITNFACDIKYKRMFELNYILWKWSTNLHTLTLYSDSNISHICKNAHRDFVKCFALMSSLRRFHLLGQHEKFDFPNIATFGQLEEFSVDSANIKFAPYFAQLDARNCKVLRVGYHIDSEDSSPNPLDANPELTSKLTHLSVGFVRCWGLNLVARRCAQFENLIKLEISIILETMASVLKVIVPLQKLKILVFHMYLFECDFEQKQYKTNPDYRNSFPIFHNTITELHLMDKCSKSYFPEFQEYQLLARIFPMVRKIHIFSNNLNKATFDAQFRPRFSDAFGERVEMTFH